MGVKNVGANDGVNTIPDLEFQNFQLSIKNKSPEELGRSLAEGNLDPWQKQEVIRELTNDLTRLMNDRGTPPEEKKEIQQILDDLKNSGVSGENGMQNISKMLQALGIPPDVAQAIVSVMGGKEFEGF